MYELALWLSLEFDMCPEVQVSQPSDEVRLQLFTSTSAVPEISLTTSSHLPIAELASSN
jgi:hypothetical protein